MGDLVQQRSRKVLHIDDPDKEKSLEHAKSFLAPSKTKSKLNVLGGKRVDFKSATTASERSTVHSESRRSKAKRRALSSRLGDKASYYKYHMIMEAKTVELDVKKLLRIDTTSVKNDMVAMERKMYELTSADVMERLQLRPQSEEEMQEECPRPVDAVALINLCSLYSVIVFLLLVGAVVMTILVGFDVIDKDYWNPADNESIANASFDLDGTAMWTAITASLLALLASGLFSLFVLSRPVGNYRMQDIAEKIQAGSQQFLIIEYYFLGWFIFGGVVVIFLIVGSQDDWWDGFSTAMTFVIGALTSGSCGYVGMTIATRANVRTAAAARDSLPAALRVAFYAGVVMSLSVVGSGLLVLTILYYSFRDLNIVAGFGFGASSIALFARVGGGIYTKAADVGADLVGKVENDIPEDDPRNPAVIADNVGDNVGDVAGMGADLFESYVGSLIAGLTLGAEYYGKDGIALPFYLCSIGILSSLFSVFWVQTKEGAKLNLLLWALRAGVYISAGLFAGLSAAPCWLLGFGYQYFIIVLLGVLCGVMIGTFTEWATSHEYSPTRSIAHAAYTGPATVIIRGLAVGMYSTVPTTIVLVGTIVGSLYLADNHSNGSGTFGVSIAAISMLSTLGVTLATDAYGPVADNAGGIAEMADLIPVVRERTDELDALGNTTAATGKGFAIGSAVLTSVALLAAFASKVERENNVTSLTLDLVDTKLLVPGIILGSVLPYIFAAQTMTAVGESAMAVVKEVRNQFNNIPGLKEGIPGAEADYRKVVGISTASAIRQMVLPGVIAVIVPPIVGYALSAQCLVGVLLGAISSGFLLAVTMATAGGAWDNAKKYVEAGQLPTHDSLEEMKKDYKSYRKQKKRMKRKGELPDGHPDKEENNGIELSAMTPTETPGTSATPKTIEMNTPSTVSPLETPRVPEYNFLKKGSQEHKAVVVGDTVGDPFKDTSGPALNILIKLMSIIALVLAPLFPDSR